MIRYYEPQERMGDVFDIMCYVSREDKSHGYKKMNRVVYQDRQRPGSRFVRCLDREKEPHDDTEEHEKKPIVYKNAFCQLPPVVLNSTVVNDADRMRLCDE